MSLGRELRGIEAAFPNAGVTGLLDDATLYVEHGVVDPATLALRRAAAAVVVPAPIALHKTGRRARLWDEIFFGIILVIPRVKDLGGIVSPTSFQAEVWNADEVAHRALSVAVTGSDGVTIGAGPTLPAFWPPFSSYLTTINVSDQGDPVVDAFVTWQFPGFTGTDCHVLGVRLTVYPLAHNWRDEFKEVVGYLCTVTQSKNGTEQRRSLRRVPIRLLELSGQADSTEEAGFLLIELQNEGRLLMTVPYWPDASHPTADVAIGATSIAVDTTTRIYEPGGLVLLSRDTKLWEAAKITAVTAGALTLANATTKAWPAASTTVVPLLPARLAQDPAPEEIVPGLWQFDLGFETEVQ